MLLVLKEECDVSKLWTFTSLCCDFSCLVFINMFNMNDRCDGFHLFTHRSITNFTDSYVAASVLLPDRFYSNWYFCSILALSPWWCVVAGDVAASTTPGLSLTCAGVCLACSTDTHTHARYSGGMCGLCMLHFAGTGHHTGINIPQCTAASSAALVWRQ